MIERTVRVPLEEHERGLLVNGLLEVIRGLRGEDGLREYTEELILKVIDAPEEGRKRKDREAR